MRLEESNPAFEKVLEMNPFLIYKLKQLLEFCYVEGAVSVGEMPMKEMVF